MNRMDSSQRAELIRRGNQAFNEGNYRVAREIFIQTSYKAGLVRIGDHYMYKRRMPLLAYGCYSRAGAQAKMQDIKLRMLGALGEWIGRDKFKPGSLPQAPTATATATDAARNTRPNIQSTAATPSAGAAMPIAAAKGPQRSFKVDRDGMVPIAVSSRLKKLALSILSRSS